MTGDNKRLFIHKLIIGRSENAKIQIIRSIITSNIAFIIDFSMLILMVEIIFKSFIHSNIELSLLDMINDKLNCFFNITLSRRTFLIVFSSIFSYLVGTIVLYFLSIKWVFSDRSISNKHYELIIFYILAAIGVILNALFIWLLTSKELFSVPIAKIVAGVVIFFFNFSARKLILFRNKKNPTN